MDIVVHKSKLEGVIKIPPSKSESHRFIINSCLAKGINEVKNIVYSEDIKATIQGLENLGAKIEKKENSLIIDGMPLKVKNNYINCNESGSTIRFLIPIGASTGESITFDGNKGLKKRPLGVYKKAFEEKGIEWNALGDDELPVKVNKKLVSGTYKIDGNISSQFITGLIYGLTLVEGKSTIKITSELESKPYIDLTIQCLKYFGVNIKNNEYRSFEIEKSKYVNKNVEVEGDYSQLAFWGLAGLLNGNIYVKGFKPHIKSSQGDKKIISVLKNFGVKIQEKEDGYIFFKSITKGIDIDIRDTPDIGPIICCIGAVSEGITIVRGIKRLRIKECDRVYAVVTELKKLGCNIVDKIDYIEIQGSVLIGGCELETYNDHRMAMALTILSSSLKTSSIIKNISCINKSYPKFLEDFTKLKGNYSFKQ